MFFRKEIKTNTDPKIIDNLLTRGVEKVFPDKEIVKTRLSKGEKIKIYLGIDPTGPTLHLGHMVCLKKLRDLQKAGHKIIMLIGDFTAMIGDPTDKTSTRKKLSKDEVIKNFRQYKKQAEKYLDFTGANRAEVRYNARWLGEMTFEKVIELSSLITVDQMLKRDMFEERTKASKPIYLHEFLYPLMQGYDSVAMDVDGEVGGNDQTFNMLMGRDLQKSINNKEKIVIAMKLLTDPTGKKMGKSEGNMVTLEDEPSQIFGKVMSWPDGVINVAFEILTDVSDEEISKIKSDIANGSNPKEAKTKLAKEIIKLTHSEKDAERAEQTFIKTFSDGAMPEDAPTANASKGALLVDVMIGNGLVASKSEWRRLLDGGAVGTMDGEIIKEPDYKIEKDLDLRVGKKRFIKIRIQ